MACSVFLKAILKLKDMMTNVDNNEEASTTDREGGKRVPNKISVAK